MTTKFQVIILTIVLSLVNLSYTVKTIDTNNIVHEVNDRIYGTIDELFFYLKINKDFTQSKTAEGYMTMHHFIQDALRITRRRYKDIYNTIKSNISNKTADQILIVNEVINEMIREQAVKYNGTAHNDTNVISIKIENFVDLARVSNLNLESLTRHAFTERESNSISQAEARRIFAGSSTSIERYPFVASVHVAGRFVCAGSLVHESFALSAASCLEQVSQEEPDSLIQIRVGSDFVSKEGSLAQITELTFHPEFDRSSLANNLVLLRTKEPLEFINGKIVAIKYDKWDSNLMTDLKDVVILGWGRRSPTDKDSVEDRPLSRARLGVYDQADCTFIYTSAYVTDKNFCVGFVDRGDGACNHDGGGPALADTQLAGVISFGSPRCGRADAPTVLTRLAHHADWIDGQLDKLEIEKVSVEPPAFEFSVSGEFSARDDINIEESDTENPRELLKREFGIGEILQGPIDALDVENLNYHDNTTYVQPEEDPIETLDKSNLTDTANLSSDEDLLELFQNIGETTATLSPEDYADSKNENAENKENEKEPFIYDEEQPLENTELSSKLIETTTNIEPEPTKTSQTITTEQETPSRDIEVTEEPNKIGVQYQFTVMFDTDPKSNENHKVTTVSHPKEQSKIKIGNKERWNSKTFDDNNKAVIILSDSGSTQRIEVDKNHPLYERGIKTLARNIYNDSASFAPVAFNMYQPPVRQIFVQEAKTQQKIPISLLSLFTSYQMIFGFKFGCRKVINVKSQMAAQWFSIVMGCLMAFVSSLTVIAPNDEGNGHYWRIISLIQYVPTFFILLSTKYTVYEFLSDLIVTPEPSKIGLVSWLYTSLMFLLKLTAAMTYCVNTTCTNVIMMAIQFLLHVPMLALDIIPVVNAILFYHIYIRMRNLKMKLLMQEITLKDLEIDYKAVADSIDTFRGRYDAMFIWGFLTDSPKLMLVLWNHLHSMKTYNSWLIKSSTYVYAMHATVQICLPAVCAEMITAQVDEIKMILHERLLMEQDEAATGRALRYIAARPLLRKARRLLPLDLRLPLTMLSLCTTYLIVIIQFTHLYD